MIDLESLTLGEVAAIEDLSGQGIATIADDDRPKGKALAALVMVIKRRSGEPTYTFNQALAVPLAEANALVGGDNDDGETDGDAEGKDDSSPTSEHD